MDVDLQRSKPAAGPFQRFADSLSNPAFLTMLKLQPLAEIGRLSLPPRPRL